MTITIRLPEELANRARQLDALRDEVIIKLIEEEIDRREMTEAQDREKQRKQAIQETYRILADLDALEPKVTPEDVEQALRQARSKE